MKKVLFAAAECFPFAKAGGLADVMGTLPGELVKLGWDVRIVAPCHRQTKDRFTLKHVLNFNVPLGWRSKYVGIEELEREGVTCWFADNEEYFGERMYKGGDAEVEQYLFFCRAILEALPMLGWMPDIIIANDWHTALLPLLIKTQYQGQPQGGIKTVLAIHNLMYQGKLPFGMLSNMMGIDEKYYTSEYLECYGCANILKGGLVFADKLVTVSPTYADEIMYDYFGEGLSGILNVRRGDLIGILNGIDTREFDPSADKRIPAAYSASDMSGKFACRSALIDELGLKANERQPVISMVTRLTEQKGIDLVCSVFDRLMSDTEVRFVLLGSGEEKYKEAFKAFESRYPGRVRALLCYDDALAHRIYAGSDLFLMPSRFEPCGISQMIAMRYGTLPIVRETGGLKDTVSPYNKYNGEGCGFSFANYNAEEMLTVIKYACEVLSDYSARGELMQRAMKKDLSFASSASRYSEVLDGLL